MSPGAGQVLLLPPHLVKAPANQAVALYHRIGKPQAKALAGQLEETGKGLGKVALERTALVPDGLGQQVA